ncbi:methyltransferase [Solirubrobacter phytolaccae]|uniref:Methyltransferase n=1 Tax=Solirubrobacter phytolaccae TaxID=1404360 RepID=A0A9X3S9C7_9ACTN|nr:methyltransferase [Solirubrobacter phytolaccae]MDA0183274.1 methyltransferase [Solirubrobacter phytolaccae]
MPPPSFSDFQTVWCVQAVAALRVAERIEAGTTRIEALAEGVDERALHSVLGHLVGEGIFEEPSPGEFALNDAARELLLGIGGRFTLAWSTMETYVRTGRPGYAHVFGRGFWADLDAHPEIAAEFDDLIGPGGHPTPDPDFELADGWDDVRTVVDVGGGTGTMLRELLRARPGLRGTLVDLPGTISRAEGDFERVAQSFFDPLPAGADLYLLRSVLNDWPDMETEALLANVAHAAAPAGRVVIIGGVAPDEASPAFQIEMLLLGGRTDALSTFRDRAERAGLTVVGTSHQADGKFVVECRPRDVVAGAINVQDV